MMNIVVTRKTSLAAEAFARTMVGKNITIQKANSIKILMLNQFKGYINQISGLIRKPEKRYWIFNDGLGGAWRFDFVVYPVQQLVIICAFYAVAINRVLPQRQRSVAQQNEGKSNVMRLSEADLRHVISESVKRILLERYKLLNEKYIPIGKGIEFKSGGWKQKSITTLQDEVGQRYHLGTDDGCFILYAEGDTPNDCHPVTHIFPEAASTIANNLSLISHRP